VGKVKGKDISPHREETIITATIQEEEQTRIELLTEDILSRLERAADALLQNAINEKILTRKERLTHKAVGVLHVRNKFGEQLTEVKTRADVDALLKAILVDFNAETRPSVAGGINLSTGYILDYLR
jgi:vacuolar-type H+-ATPase subunit E/Vma4